MTGLEEILRAVRARLEERRAHRPEAELRARIGDQAPPRDLAEKLRRPRKGRRDAEPLRVIGELKRRSPSAGVIREDLDPASAARELAQAGCAALSILTEPDFFGGSLDALRAARGAVGLPLLRKDFILDPYQITEARACGADAVLLLAAVLDDAQMRRCRDAAEALGMQVLAEAHGRQELDRVLSLQFPIVGINARNLSTFDVNLEQALRWAQTVPQDRICVAESGVRSRRDADQVRRAGVDAALVGEGLMRDPGPSRRFVELFGKDP